MFFILKNDRMFYYLIKYNIIWLLNGHHVIPTKEVRGKR